MRIVLFDYVFVPDKPGASGLSDLIWNWARHLVALGDEVHIVAPYPQTARPPDGAIVHRFPLPPIGYRNVLGHLLIALRGWIEIRKLGRIDLVHAPEYLSTGVFVLLNSQVPIVLTVPGNIYERIAHGNPFDWSMTLVLKAMARLSAARCACVVATSDEMRRWWLRTGTPASRIALIPHGIDTELFCPVPGARASIGMPPGSPVVLYVGRLSHEKGIEHLLEAVQQVRESFPDLQLHLVGEGPFRERLSKLVGQLHLDNHVTFHGWVNQADLPRYYSAADVTVLPSFTEGMPRTMLEAMACGSPFLGTEITGIVDHVRDSDTGFLVPPADSRALAEKLSLVLADAATAREVGERGRQYARRELEWRQIVQRVRDEVYYPIARSSPQS